jgi:hypothetical protein
MHVHKVAQLLHLMLNMTGSSVNTIVDKCCGVV